MTGAKRLGSRPDRRQWGFFALAMFLGVVCLRLGVWQLERREQRLARNASIEASLALPPLALPADLQGDPNLEYRRGRVRGTYDPDDEIYLSNRSRDGVAGFHVVTPLRLDGRDEVILVDRGWISDSDYRMHSPETWAVEGPVEVEGLLLPSQREPGLTFLADRIPAPGDPPLAIWRALYIPGIRQQLTSPALEVYLLQDSPAPAEGAPIPSPELDLSQGPHLGYAVQWFAFAATAFVGGWWWIRRGRRGPSPSMSGVQAIDDQ